MSSDVSVLPPFKEECCLHMNERRLFNERRHINEMNSFLRRLKFKRAAFQESSRRYLVRMRDRTYVGLCRWAYRVTSAIHGTASHRRGDKPFSAGKTECARKTVASERTATNGVDAAIGTVALCVNFSEGCAARRHTGSNIIYSLFQRPTYDAGLGKL